MMKSKKSVILTLVTKSHHVPEGVFMAEHLYSTNLVSNTLYFQKATLVIVDGKSKVKPGVYDELTVEVTGGYWEVEPDHPQVNRLVISRGKINGKDTSVTVVVTSEILPKIVGRKKIASAPRADKKRIAIGSLEVEYGPEIYGVLLNREQITCNEPKLKINKGYLEVLARHKMPSGFQISNPLVRAYRFSDVEGQIEDRHQRGSAFPVSAKELLIYSVHSPRFSFF
jgi:hypothetical protein